MSSNQDPPAEVGSFESRISHPAATEEKKPEPLNDLKDIKKALEPTKIDWADDVATPTEEKKVEHEPKIKEPESNLLEPEHNVEVVLADMQSDESNPLYSAAQSFEDIQLHDDILKGLYENNMRKPSKIQERALPLLLSNPPRNMIAQSQSGTGKTAAFVITILSRIDLSSVKPQAIILVPTRELATQAAAVVKTIGKHMAGLVVAQAVPGAHRKGEQIAAHVLVGTPITTSEYMRYKQFAPALIRVLCLDEADNMLEKGMRDQCRKVRSFLPPTTQTMLFSATFPDEVMEFARQFCPQANEIKLKHNELTVAGISQMFMDCPDESSKYEVLVKLYGLMTIGSSIIFVKTKDTARRIERAMLADGHQVALLSSELQGSDRDAVMERFRKGEAKILITTNVLARGIDVQTVSMVINYDMPMKFDQATGRQSNEPDFETYLHRIGRTGRFGRVGVSISFVHDKQSYEALRKIAEHFEIDLVKLNQDDWDETEELVQKVIKSSRAGGNFKGGAGAI